MPIEMVGSQVKQHGNMRSEILGGLQLEAAQFDHEHGPFRNAIHGADQGNTNVSPHKSRNPGSLEDLTEQSRGRRLAVSTRDADQRSVQEPACNLHLRINLNVPLSCGLQLRQVPGNTGADHDQILAQEGLQPVHPEFNPNLLC